MFVLLFLHFFVQTNFPLFITLNKDLLEPIWETLSACFIVVDPFESKNQSLINGREKAVIKKSKNLKAFIDYSQAIDVNWCLEDYNRTKKRQVVIVFDDMILNCILVYLYNYILNSHWIVPKRRKLNFHLFLYENFISKCLKL